MDTVPVLTFGRMVLWVFAFVKTPHTGHLNTCRWLCVNHTSIKLLRKSFKTTIFKTDLRIRWERWESTWSENGSTPFVPDTGGPQKHVC